MTKLQYIIKVFVLQKHVRCKYGSEVKDIVSKLGRIWDKVTTEYIFRYNFFCEINCSVLWSVISNESLLYTFKTTLFSVL